MATSVYKNYFENFLESLKFLFPEDNKTLIVISDGLQEYNEKTIRFNDSQQNTVKICS